MIQPLRDDLMVQQQLPATAKGKFRIAAWQHMVAVIMLNQTGRKPVKTVFPVFMHHWPTPSKFVRASKGTRSQGCDLEPGHGQCAL
jgi:adenine-specific DNA glycosylase